MKKSPYPWTVTLAFVATALAVGWIAFGVYWFTHQLVRSYDSVTESHQALEKLQAIKELVQAGQSSVYNYVITGHEERLDIYRNSRTLIPRKLRELETLLKTHPSQKSSLRQFRRLYSLHQDYLARIVQARKEHSLRAASKWVAEEDDHSIREVLNLLLDQVQKEQGKVLKRRSATTSEHSLQANGALAGAAALSLLLIACVFALLRRESGHRRVAESVTQRLETFLRSIVERIPYQVLVKEAGALRLTLVNKAAVEWFGRSEEELLGSNDFDLLPPEAARVSTEQDRNALRSGEPVDIEEVLVREGQDPRVLHTQKVAIPDQTGAPAFLLTISEDITERKQAERMLEISRDTAVQSERLKSEFIRNMSHEIRTPLSVVLGMNSLLLDTHLTEEQRMLALKVANAAQGLTRLTKGILDFSKIEAGTFTVEPQEMNVRQNIEAVLSMFAAQAKVKGVGIVSVISPTIPEVLVGDPVRLRQVLTELVGNAVKFTARGEAIVRVQETEQNENQLWLTFKVTDTGPGIDEKAQKHLFEPFRQGDGSPTRSFGGTGLGLAVSKRIVELMGGQIGFSSTPNQGSTFWCTVPFHRSGVLGSAIHAATRPWTLARVLVAEENAVSRQKLCEQLRSWALACEGVSSGEAALDLLRREHAAGRPFKIILLDMHLMDMDGVTFARTIRADPELAATQLVALTETPIDPADLSTLGFVTWINNPPPPQALLARLAAIIDSPNQTPKSAA